MKRTICALLALILIFVLASCAAGGGAPAEKTDVRIYVLTGPTGVGAVNMWAASENGEGGENYSFTAAASPDEAVAKLSAGEADIAAVSTNLAAKLYKKTEGGIKILAVNTLARR